jgi:hypothetical protein
VGAGVDLHVKRGARCLVAVLGTAAAIAGQLRTTKFSDPVPRAPQPASATVRKAGRMSLPLRFLKRLGEAQPDLAMRLSSWGIRERESGEAATPGEASVAKLPEAATSLQSSASRPVRKPDKCWSWLRILRGMGEAEQGLGLRLSSWKIREFNNEMTKR